MYTQTSDVVSYERRKFVARAFAREDGENTLRQSIALAAPVDLVEQHHDLVAWSKSEVDPSARVCYSANAHQSSASLRFLLFEQRSHGSKIVFHQHGGGYGIDEQHPGEFHDTLLGDVFYSWGWRRPDLGAKVRPLPTASPARHKGLTGRHYLLMSLPITNHFYRLQAFVLPGHVAKSLSQTEIFLANLSSDVELHIRASGSVEYPTSAKNAFRGKLEMDSLKEPGVIAASRSRLVIHNYLGTSWLETLAMNVPTVCFYDPAIYRAREAARPFIDALHRVGVIHHSGADAARFVNDLKGDPSSWWSKPEVQDAREKFVARYANFTDNWLPGWIEEFERLLEE
jgi:putative transferase (TIGR04331 family)